jgi:16S rRNA G966 N2-methylase RsmD
VVLGNALVSLKKTKTYFNIIFLDPPYEKTFLIRKMLRILAENGNIDHKSYIVVENSVYNKWNFIPDYFEVVKDKKAASTRFMIIKLKSDYEKPLTNNPLESMTPEEIEDFFNNDDNFIS